MGLNEMLAAPAMLWDAIIHAALTGMPWLIGAGVVIAGVPVARFLMTAR